jgi:transposase-like protein
MAEDVLAYRRFPGEHQRQPHSTNVLERLNKGIKRRLNVVGIFPSPTPTTPSCRHTSNSDGQTPNQSTT